MVSLVNKTVQKMSTPTEAIKQQRESCFVKESRRLTTALEDKAVVKICMRMK